MIMSLKLWHRAFFLVHFFMFKYNIIYNHMHPWNEYVRLTINERLRDAYEKRLEKLGLS